VATIQGYRFGRVEVDGREHTRDLIVLPGRVIGQWWREYGHALALEDLASALDELPEHLVIGTGAMGGMRPDREAIEALEARGVQVEVHQTPDAIRRYSELDPQKTALAMHLTC
jgi:hypothetical protein